MEKNLISYIIPIWEGSTSEDIEFSIESLIQDNFLINEILIVFDGHKSFEVEFFIPSIFINKVKYIYCGINGGPGISRNKGALFAKSKYLFFLDCGDQSVPKRAKLQLNSLLKNDVSFGDIREISPSGKVRVRKGARSFKNAKNLISLRNPFNNVTMAIKKDSFLEIGGYANLRVGEDWVLMGKIIKKGLKIACIESELVNVFIGHDFLQRRWGSDYIKEINKCLKELYKLKLMNKLTYLISLSSQFLMRRIIPLKILSIIYRLLRE